MQIIKDINLLGDTLYSLKPIAEYGMQHGAYTVLTAPHGFATEMLRQELGSQHLCADLGAIRGSEAVIDLSAGTAGQLAAMYLWQTGHGLHISECYAQMLDVDCTAWHGDFRPLTGWVRGRRQVDTQNPYVVIAPFSRSCSRHAGLPPNKTPDHKRWTLLLAWLSSRTLTPKILTGPDESWTGCEADTVSADTLDALVSLLTGATAVITVDNGVGHVASALGCRTIILWPPVSNPTFIAPTYNPGTTLIYARPGNIRADQLCTLISGRLRCQ